MNEKESHERQVAFLQAHEAQITRFIQTKEASTVAKVEYNWRTVAAQSSMVYEYPYLPSTSPVTITNISRLTATACPFTLTMSITQRPSSISTASTSTRRLAVRRQPIFPELSPRFNYHFYAENVLGARANRLTSHTIFLIF
ncbi:hypothetical protein [Lacticaseibacillus nasuensis]|uniref:hypothetical protein n=1 Tax=Lacticaseibacillus nasuensis TaxID=944671 RepID=UPI0006D2A7E8|nr:hypothetical protein [Lacticaseibacillus nasuensis]